MYTTEERVFIVRNYWVTGSFKQCQAVVLRKFGGRKPRTKQTIANFVKKLGTTGGVLDIHAGGKPPMSDQRVADVKQRLQQSPKKSLRRLSQETGLSYSTCQRAAKKAKLKAYRVTVDQELKPLDTQKRMAYCEWFMKLFGEDDELLDITWYSDEAWFHLSLYVNSQNTRIWATEHPHEFHEVPLHSEKTSSQFTSLLPVIIKEAAEIP